jgi:hypothetical protein
MRETARANLARLRIVPSDWRSRRAPAAAVVAAPIVVLAAGFGSAAYAQGAPRPLLRVHATLTLDAHGRAFFDEDLLVAVTGYSQGQQTTGHNDDLLAGWLYSPGSATGSPQQLAELQTALGAGRIGLLSGTCQVVPQFVTQGTIELTWYGRGLRRSDLTVVFEPTQGDVPQCPRAVCAILAAIDVYAHSVLGLEGLPDQCSVSS